MSSRICGCGCLARGEIASEARGYICTRLTDGVHEVDVVVEFICSFEKEERTGEVHWMEWT